MSLVEKQDEICNLYEISMTKSKDEFGIFPFSYSKATKSQFFRKRKLTRIPRMELMPTAFEQFYGQKSFQKLSLNS